MSPQALRGRLAAVCIVVYVLGMFVLISLAARSPLTPLIEVGYAAAAYCAIAATCIVAMVIFARRVPVASPDAPGGDA